MFDALLIIPKASLESFLKTIFSSLKQSQQHCIGISRCTRSQERRQKAHRPSREVWRRGWLAVLGVDWELGDWVRGPGEGQQRFRKASGSSFYFKRTVILIPPHSGRLRHYRRVCIPSLPAKLRENRNTSILRDKIL